MAKEIFNYYGQGYGEMFEHPSLDSYRDSIDKELIIVGPFEEDEENEVIKILELSLENGKSFYENATADMKKNMEDYEKEITERIRY